LLQSAADRLGRPCTRTERTGRVEREVVAAAEGCDLLILARDGDRTHLGPHSLGPASRFVVDHAPCPVLLVWPEASPDLSTMPPPPPRP
jgi:nucleotide-binding universal stress UspA family protein